MTLVDRHIVQRPADLERGVSVDYCADSRYGIAPVHGPVGHFERGNAWRYCRDVTTTLDRYRCSLCCSIERKKEREREREREKKNSNTRSSSYRERDVQRRPENDEVSQRRGEGEVKDLALDVHLHHSVQLSVVSRRDHSAHTPACITHGRPTTQSIHPNRELQTLVKAYRSLREPTCA